MSDANPVVPLFEIGHFYSPIVNPGELRSRANEIWRPRDKLAGIDFRPEMQLQVLERMFPEHFPHFNYPVAAVDAVDGDGRQWYFLDNDQFSNFDAASLFVLMRELRPKRVIEVGSGFSSLLMADVRRRFFPDACKIQCIEPYPREFLLDSGYGLELINSKVQDVPLSFFESLEAGDFLFIDSSHVSKTGSDVNYLIFEVLPRLAAGIFVHIHDIFLPSDYPLSWVIEENRSWNEQYLLQAYLMFNNKAHVVFGAGYARDVLIEQTRQAIQGKVDLYGGSFWFQTA